VWRNSARRLRCEGCRCWSLAMKLDIRKAVLHVADLNAADRTSKINSVLVSTCMMSVVFVTTNSASIVELVQYAPASLRAPLEPWPQRVRLEQLWRTGLKVLRGRLIVPSVRCATLSVVL